MRRSSDPQDDGESGWDRLQTFEQYRMGTYERGYTNEPLKESADIQPFRSHVEALELKYQNHLRAPAPRPEKSGHAPYDQHCVL